MFGRPNSRWPPCPIPCHNISRETPCKILLARSMESLARVSCKESLARSPLQGISCKESIARSPMNGVSCEESLLRRRSLSRGVSRKESIGGVSCEEEESLARGLLRSP